MYKVMKHGQTLYTSASREGAEYWAEQYDAEVVEAGHPEQPEEEGPADPGAAAMSEAAHGPF